MKPIINAASVGKINTGQCFLIAFSIEKVPPFYTNSGRAQIARPLNYSKFLNLVYYFAASDAQP
jgi:hypothetical protein